ncbi:MAG: hypothetical protein KBS94_00510 [Prevotella sp.]|nr:hypothetical protein [Candidatus Equicola faecalis]
MYKLKVSSIGKILEPSVNEDSVIAKGNLIAVSDGAGGGGVFAERWSEYLINNLPSTPITSFDRLDSWIETIWEPFYLECEDEAKKIGGMFLDKFYDEGSFATLACAWYVNGNVNWMAYGDSVVFHYNRKIGLLEHSFGALVDFNSAPYLINSKDELNPKGFKCGTFSIGTDDVVFICSDALAHYILSSYCIANKGLYDNELKTAIESRTKNENFILSALNRKIDNFGQVVNPLFNSISHDYNFRKHITKLLNQKVIANDDYSMAIMHFSM